MDLYNLESDIKMDWYPKEKLNYVKRKLKGDNPGYITRYVNLSELICDRTNKIRQYIPIKLLTEISLILKEQSE